MRDDPRSLWLQASPATSFSGFCNGASPRPAAADLSRHTKMIIAIDEAIPFWREAFEQAGELHPFSGRNASREILDGVDALIVRSVTTVDAGLLEGTAVRFVGTATIGMDHLDLAYLRSRGIRCVNAHGSNANAVAEYVTASLLTIARRRGWTLRGTSLAVIGAGNVGRHVERHAAALGMKVRLCDPPLRESTGNPAFKFLGEVLDSDIISLHVPLTQYVRYPTYRMFNREVFSLLSAGQFLINTSRGEVIVEEELKKALKNGNLGGAALDVWGGEPHIDPELLEMVDIGTPHIAGYSLDGKACATAMILEELYRCFGLPDSWEWRDVLPPPVTIRLEPGLTEQEAIASAVLQTCGIEMDDADLREFSLLSAAEAGRRFDLLRNEYPLRREFHNFMVELPGECGRLGPALRALGFQTSDPATSP